MLKSLQAGRGLAALSVVAFHLHGSTILPLAGRSRLADLSAHGNAGVPFFFVLSGFIIALTHAKDIGKPEQLRRFLGNRVRRVYPTYWLYTAVTLGAAMICGGDVPIPAGPGDWFSTLTLVRVTDGATPLTVAWTLFYEIAFYALFGVLILSRQAGALLFGCWWAVIVALHQYASPTSPVGVWTSMVCMNFFVGMAACWLHSRLRPGLAWALLGVGIVGLCLCGVWVDHGLSAQGFEFFVALACGLAICGLASIETRTPPNFGWLGLVGDASYTLYLVHGHLTPFILKLMLEVGLFGWLSADAIFIISLLATVAVSLALYLAVEKPLARWRKSPPRRATRAPAIASRPAPDRSPG